MNFIQSLLGLATKPERPLHVGEVMALWATAAAFEEGRTIILLMLNHTSDPELKRYMEQYISDFEEPCHQRIRQFMREHGIQQPQAATDKAKADEQAIPSGGKLLDREIAMLLSAKLRSGLQLVQHGILECLNYGVGSLLIEIEGIAYKQSFVLREMMERRGWLQVPPPWHVSMADS